MERKTARQLDTQALARPLDMANLADGYGIVLVDKAKYYVVASVAVAAGLLGVSRPAYAERSHVPAAAAPTPVAPDSKAGRAFTSEKQGQPEEEWMKYVGGERVYSDNQMVAVRDQFAYIKDVMIPYWSSDERSSGKIVSGALISDDDPTTKTGLGLEVYALGPDAVIVGVRVVGKGSKGEDHVYFPPMKMGEKGWEVDPHGNLKDYVDIDASPTIYTFREGKTGEGKNTIVRQSSISLGHEEFLTVDPETNSVVWENRDVNTEELRKTHIGEVLKVLKADKLPKNLGPVSVVSDTPEQYDLFNKELGTEMFYGMLFDSIAKQTGKSPEAVMKAAGKGKIDLRLPRFVQETATHTSYAIGKDMSQKWDPKNGVEIRISDDLQDDEGSEKSVIHITGEYGKNKDRVYMEYGWKINPEGKLILSMSTSIVEYKFANFLADTQLKETMIRGGWRQAEDETWLREYLKFSADQDWVLAASALGGLANSGKGQPQFLADKLVTVPATLEGEDWGASPIRGLGTPFKKLGGFGYTLISRV